MTYFQKQIQQVVSSALWAGFWIGVSVGGLTVALYFAVNL